MTTNSPRVTSTATTSNISITPPPAKSNPTTPSEVPTEDAAAPIKTPEPSPSSDVAEDGFHGTTFTNARSGSSPSSLTRNHSQKTLGFTSTTGTPSSRASEKILVEKSHSPRPEKPSLVMSVLFWRVFDFLETWGLINYSPTFPNRPLNWMRRQDLSLLRLHRETQRLH